MKRLILTFLILINLFQHSFCQFSKNLSFTFGEKLEYEVYYNLGPIWIKAGFFNFLVKNGTYQGKTVYHFDSNGRSLPSYDWFYKVRDRFQAFIDTTTLKPLWAERSSYDGGFEVYENYVFDYQNKKVDFIVRTSDKPLQHDSRAINGDVLDILSATYYVRNLDFSGFQINEKIPVYMLLGGGIYPLFVRYLGKETIVTQNKLKYNCLKFSCLLIAGTIFKGGEDMHVWVSDDKNHVPIMVQAKILVGSVKASLINAENLKNPFSSKIKPEK